MAVRTLLLLTLTVQFITALQWTEEGAGGEEEQTMFTCKGENATIGWHLKTAGDEELASLQWIFQNASTTDIVAVLAAGHFNPGPSYTDRVLHVPDDGLVLKDVRSGDAGRYSVEAIGLNSTGVLSFLRRSATLQVSEGLVLGEGGLRLSQEPEAVWDSGLEQWTVRLTCGHFTPTGRPPFDVSWHTPTGETLSSTTYEDGKFILALTVPFSEGKYGCRVPAYIVHDVCVHKSKPHNDVIADFTLDDVRARLALLEAQQKSLRKENRKLQRDNVCLTGQVQDLEDEVEKVRSSKRGRPLDVSSSGRPLDVSSSANVVERLDSLTSLVQDINERANRTVAFNARLTKAVNLKNTDDIILSDVTLNAGEGYDATTGVFTAPISGLYFFIGMASPYKNGERAHLRLKVEGQNMAYSYSYLGSDQYQSGTVHYAQSLDKGQRVWLECNYGGYFRNDRRTIFSGFLIHALP